MRLWVPHNFVSNDYKMTKCSFLRPTYSFSSSYVPKAHCKKCYCILCDYPPKNSAYSMENSLDCKLKNQNICLGCYIAREKRYNLVMYDTYGNPCGGSAIYRVVPKNPKEKLRLHHMAYYEYHIRNIRTMKSFQPVHRWEDIWQRMEGWMEEKWAKKFRGGLERGIYCADGNGMIAFVEDKKGDMYYIHGVWG